MPRRDPAWQHCTQPDPRNSDMLKCNYCQVTYHGGVNRMKYHIAQLPGHDIVPCPNLPSLSVMEEMRTYLNRREDKKKNKAKLVDLLAERQMEKAGSGSVSEHRASMSRIRKRTVDGWERMTTDTGGHASSSPADVESDAQAQQQSGSNPPLSSSTYGSSSHGLESSYRPVRGRLVDLLPPRHGPGTQQTIETSMRAKEDVIRRARKILAQFWYSQGLPLYAFASPMFQRVCDAIGECGAGNFRAPTYTEMRTSMLQDVKHDIEEMMTEHKKAWDKFGCSILADGWTDRRDRSLVNFIIASVSGTMFLKSIDASENIRNAEFLFDQFKKVIEEVGPSKVVQVVTDNGSAYKAAGRLLMHYYPHLYWTPCAAHCIDLLLEDLARLPWIKKVVRRAKFISKFVYTHSHVHHLFRQHSNGKEIIRPGNTRFATNFILLDSMQEVKQALMDMFVNPLWSHDERFAPLRRTTEARRMTKIVYDCVEGAGKFWYEAKNVIQVTQPLVIVLRKVDGERPSLAYVYEAMCRAKEAIRCYLTENGLLDRFSSISTKINERWGNQMHNDLHAAAHILNPQFGFGRDFDIADEDVRLKVQLENVLDRLVLDPVKRGQVAKELDMYRKKMGMNFRRPVAEIMKSDMKPEDWWTNYGLDTLALKEIAIRIVSQPCSASGCERNWSVFEHIHSRKRNRLTTERLNDLVFVHHNLRFDLKELASTSSEVLDLDDIHPSLPCTQWIGEGDEHDDTSQDDAIPCHTRVCTPTVVTGHADVGDHSDDDSRDQIHDENIASNASSDSESSDEEEPLFSAEELGMPPVEGDPVPAEFSRHSSVYRPRRKLPIHRNAGEGSSQNP